MSGRAIELLHFITDAIDRGLGDTEINKRIEIVANNDQITSDEYFQIYDEAMSCYKIERGI